MPIICRSYAIFWAISYALNIPKLQLGPWVPGLICVDLQRSQGKDAAEIISSVEFLAALDFLASLLFHLRGSL